MRKEFHRALLGLALAACVWFAIHGVIASNRPGGSDFTIYYDAGRAVLLGQNPYDVFGFIYLPFFALCMAPLSLLPYGVAVIVWQVGSFALLVWIARACVALVRADGLPTPAWLAWAPLVCVLRLADSNLANGQVNLFTLALAVLALRAWIGGRESASGAWLGLAAALKIVPGFLALVFVVRGSWRASGACALVALACVFGAPALTTGFTQNTERLRTWWQNELHPYAVGGDRLLARREYLPGQSLTPVLYRILSATPATSRGEKGPRTNVTELEPESTRWIVLAAQAAWCGATLVTLARSRRRGGAGARLREAGLAIACALSIAPLVHKAHMVWLIVPYAVLVAGTPGGMSRRVARLRWAFVALSIALIGLTTPALFGRALSTSLLSHNAVFFGLQCVFVGLIIDVWCGSRAEAGGSRAAGGHGGLPAARS